VLWYLPRKRQEIIILVYFFYMTKYSGREIYEYASIIKIKPVLVVARSKAYVSGRSTAEIVGSNPTGGMDICLL